ncbi:MAG: hypothetical protein JO225_02940, partial [Candidatus Eremiobacteraeota bacterium]|nr:hypothetical protein [Candidatus Eremiobacteraeota bacterium]
MSFVTSVTGTAPIASSGGTTPNISMTTPLPVADGGTGAATLASSPYAVLSPSAPQSGELSITGGYSTSNGTGLAVGGVGLIYADGTNATIKLPSPGGNLFVQNHAGSGNAVQITDSGT